MINLPADWIEALQAAMAVRRVIVIGPSDAGKSCFVHELLARQGDRSLADLDPGQKMIGAPGTVGLGKIRDNGRLSLQRFMFTGSTSPGHLREFLSATRELLHACRERLVVNTAGHVEGVGARLQQLTVEVVQPDLVIAISDDSRLDQILAGLSATSVKRIQRLPMARRKGPRERRRARQAAFIASLEGGEHQVMAADIPFRPGRPATFVSGALPVCAISDMKGRQICMGLLEQADERGIYLFAQRLDFAPGEIILGRMWAKAAGQTWRLTETSQPGWGAPLVMRDGMADMCAAHGPTNGKDRGVRE